MSPALSTTVQPPSMVERMTLILDAFTGPGEHRSLEEVVARTRLPRSTTHRILNQLVRVEWLQHTVHGYAMGRRARRLSSARDIEHGVLRTAAGPWLDDLARRTKLVVLLGVPSGRKVVVLDRVSGGNPIDVPVHVSQLLPAPCTALGKAMLARAQPETIDVEYATPWESWTPAGITTLAELHRDLGRVRGRGGVAVENEECFPGIWGLAAAITGRSRPVGAIALVTDERSMLDRALPMLLHAVNATARAFHAGLPQAHSSLDQEISPPRAPRSGA